MRVLLVEDEDPKRDHLIACLSRISMQIQLVIAKSVRSAVDELRKEHFDLVILDMSLPTFDIKINEAGGRPQGFGGVEVMRYMERLEVKTPVVVVTAYEAFSEDGRELDLTSLTAQLNRDHANVFVELIYYNSISGSWEEKLKNTVKSALGI